MKVAQSCLTLCHLTDCGPPGSSVHGILQAGIPDWVTIVNRPASGLLEHLFSWCLYTRVISPAGPQKRYAWYDGTHPFKSFHGEL